MHLRNPVARRRSELSAKRTQLILILAGAALGPLCAVAPIAAQVGNSSMPAATGQRLTRDDVDVLLRQARSSIQQGNLEQADALVKRTEDARAHYPFFHMGPTPTSVRRELNRAAPRTAIERPGVGSEHTQWPRPVGRGERYFRRHRNRPVSAARSERNTANRRELGVRRSAEFGRSTAW